MSQQIKELDQWGTYVNIDFKKNNSNFKRVEVFKTNVILEKETLLVIQKLRYIFPEAKINFDLDDCDNILRVEFYKDVNYVRLIEEIVSTLGFEIESLP
jgi:hypothetical protein